MELRQLETFVKQAEWTAARHHQRNAASGRFKSLRVFVYGSLLSGLGNNGWLEGARLIGTVKTVDAAWTMIDMGGFPGLVDGGSTRIVGEVYEVDAQILAGLDRLESCPSFYYRKIVNLSDGSSALMYILNRNDSDDGDNQVQSGDWRAHYEREGDQHV